MMEHGGSRGLMLSSKVPRVNASCLLNFISLLLAAATCRASSNAYDGA